MNREAGSIAEYRAFYARLIVGSGDAPRLIEAFARVPREDFVGPGPWRVCTAPSRYLSTPSDDPRWLYQDILVGLDVDRAINNGQPSLHAACLAACLPQPGESALHIGAGTGYYTAVLAELVGSNGHVIGYEIVPELAERATANLRRWPQVEIRACSATDGPLPTADVIYVSAGASHPPATWLDALDVRGRLLFPLTTEDNAGCVLLVTRLAAGQYAAKALLRCGFIPCTGARDLASSISLANALATRPLEAIRSLRRDEPPDATAWCKGPGWWLSTAAPMA